MPWLEVTSGGALTTVQDLGRYGAQALGVPVSGALDSLSLRLGNALVGNPEGEASLEIRMLGPTLKIRGGPVRVALVGTEAPIQVIEPERRLLPSGRSVTFENNVTFRVGGTPDTAVCYLVIQGGFDLPAPFGSQSTYMPAALGGCAGRPLQSGDTLPLRRTALEHQDDLCLPQFSVPYGNGPIRVVLGPQEDHFTGSALSAFFESAYNVLPSSSRMGLNLEGKSLTHRDGYNIASDGIVAGSIQVPGNGQPILLLADRQTTGGYPKIATVISADLPRVGRLLPGEEIRFVPVTVEEAEILRRTQETMLGQISEKLTNVLLSPEEIGARLLCENLISGIIRA